MIRRAAFLLCLLLAVPAAALAVDHADGLNLQTREVAAQGGVGGYGYRTTSNNLVNITFTNYGSWGLGYTSATTPNFSFPAGANFEHMVRGGLWIGGRVLCDSGCVDQIAVSFGSEDQNGSVGTPVTEFTPLPNTPATRLVELSSLANSIVYSPLAVSEQDLIAHFRDNPGTQVGSEPHVPLNVDVTEAIYSWSFSFAENFVIQHFTIRNVGELLRNVFITHYTEMQSLNKADYPLWPSFPSGAAPYAHKYYQYVPALRLLSEHYCNSVQSGCNFDRVPAVVGTMLLGTYPDSLGMRFGGADSSKVLTARFLTHGYSGSLGIGDTTYGRFTDPQKYSFMQHPTEIADQSQDPNDPSQWITVGPIPTMQSGDSISVDFAFLGGASADPAEAEALVEKAAQHALLAFNLSYKLPTPPPSPRLYARPGDHTLELLWEGSPDTTYDPTSPTGQERDFEGYRIYFGESANNMQLIAQFDRKDTTSFNTGLDSLRMPLDPPVVFNHTVHTPRGDS
ncbi:MAG TPA: hypothetical protein VMS93_14075, partial [Candidatus Saccharimonadales bacterium]|nr:hypothetical protein [Candidatus Saccharimonadales bacterium]